MSYGTYRKTQADPSGQVWTYCHHTPASGSPAMFLLLLGDVPAPRYTGVSPWGLSSVVDPQAGHIRGNILGYRTVWGGRFTIYCDTSLDTYAYEIPDRTPYETPFWMLEPEPESRCTKWTPRAPLQFVGAAPHQHRTDEETRHAHPGPRGRVSTPQPVPRAPCDRKLRR
jgi:hypothetical protein